MDDDGDYLRALWQSARDEAQADPNRPPSAAELVKKGTLQSWGDIRVKFPDVGEYESFLLEAAPGTPKPVVGRLATVLAAFKHFDRPLEGESPVAGRVGPELISFDLPGQNVLAMMCTLKFPEYVEDESCVHPGTFCHGTSFSAAVGIAEHGGVAVSHHSGEAFPSYGFSGRGSLVPFSRESLISAATKTATRSKSQGGVLVLVEATLPRSTPSVEGGQEYMHSTCRDSGSARSGEHFLVAPRHAILRGIAAAWPR